MKFDIGTIQMFYLFFFTIPDFDKIIVTELNNLNTQITSIYRVERIRSFSRTKKTVCKIKSSEHFRHIN